MPSPRSFFTARQCHLDDYDPERQRANGRFGARRNMNEAPPDVPSFSFRSMFSSLQSPATMQQSEEQSKPASEPAPSSHEASAAAPDYAGRMFRKFHHHTISDSTAGSNTSSPTTTISTVDDSSATEPSPGSSPESPPPASFSTGMIRPHTSDDGRPFFELQKQAPPKKGRNLKNLAVDTSRGTGRAASTTSLPLPALNGDSLSNGGASPAFVKPPTPPKRKPSNLGLTLLTPASNKALPQEIKLAIPPTPANVRPGALRHFQSSPSLPLLPELKTQHFAAPARMQTTLETIFSPSEAPQKSLLEEEEEQNFDIPLSKEEKPEAYPDGPICVYEPNVDLYLEPTAKQVREYDVILNVASEVRNPLIDHTEPDPSKNELRIDGGGGIQLPPRRGQTALEHPEARTVLESSPATPKATPLVATFDEEAKATPAKEPEYIHIKWEHNSDIVPDLLRLVKLIDEKVSQGKRVLVHCQCGVSRSASLVVAYGLYKNPTLSVQQAYDAVKKRSKWIGPNMNLIMQLQEFRSSLMNGGLLTSNRGMTPITPSSQFKEWSRAFPSAPANGAVPLSAGATTETAEALAAFNLGPSSAPSGKPWLPKGNPTNGQRARAISAVKPGTAYVNTSGRVVPVVPVLKVVEPETAPTPAAAKPTPLSDDNREESGSATPTEAMQSPRSGEFAMTPLQPSPDVDPADAFGLMSPSSTEFSSSPFDRPTLLASLGMGSVRQQDDVPRRTSSLKSRPKPQQHSERSDSLLTSQPPRLRGKISSPSMREQQQLQSMQAQLEASLPHSDSAEPLMSPRATEFTQNPFALALPAPSPHPHAPPEDPPRTPGVDPRSPAHKGVSPITRSILDVL